MNPIPKYPLDTASKLALIRQAGYWYDTKLYSLYSSPKRFIKNFMDCKQPLNAAFHYFITHQGKEEPDTLKYKATGRYAFTDPRAVYGTA